MAIFNELGIFFYNLIRFGKSVFMLLKFLQTLVSKIVVDADVNVVNVVGEATTPAQLKVFSNAPIFVPTFKKVFKTYRLLSSIQFFFSNQFFSFSSHGHVGHSTENQKYLLSLGGEQLSIVYVGDAKLSSTKQRTTVHSTTFELCDSFL